MYNNEFGEMVITATREKFRFKTTKGNLTIEDLWDLPLKSTRTDASLNEIAKSIHKRIQDSSVEDFVDGGSRDKTDEIKLEIVKYIIKVRQDEIEYIKSQHRKQENIEIIKKAIEEKERSKLTEMSIDELKEKLNEMQ